MKSECILCTFQKECPAEALFLYATTPILRKIVHSHLSAIGAEFRFQNDLFKLTGNTAQTIEELRGRLSEVERGDIRLGRERGAAMLAASTLEQYGRHLETAWFDDALENDRFTTFFQPIVDARHFSVHAHECLVRLLGGRMYNGGEIMEAAISRGCLHVFDAYVRRLSIRKAGAQFRAGTKVFVNFMPSSIYDPAFCMASTLEEMANTVLKPSDIVFEVVESDAVRDVKHLQKICDYYRKNGFGFALDDVGTGSNSLQMVCDLQPDYIKLDKSLIMRVSEPMYQAAVQKLTEFADQFKLNVIAEGVEDAATMLELRKMGIAFMQGYYFGKPAAYMKEQITTPTSTPSDLTQISQQLGSSVMADKILPKVMA